MTDTLPNSEEPATHELHTLPDKSVVIICARQVKNKNHLPKCRVCKQPAGLLCDGPHIHGTAWGQPNSADDAHLCSMPLCQKHAFASADGTKHYCWHCRHLAKEATLRAALEDAR